GIPGQILLGHLSDRIGREWVWTVSCLGFASCFVALIRLESHPTLPLLYAMIISQGGLGYGLTSIFGAIVAEIYAGKHYDSVFGTLMMAGGALGHWATGALYDMQGTYASAFWICVGLIALSVLALWRAAPRKVRAVAGRVRLLRQETEANPSDGVNRAG